ncbi:hypothetical protein WICPIJ_008482 [Wickerhamomyces pijperi]|uniref:Hydrophobin n=1 Tax=Wickerhamomyces pijperi TaxID=599730 RepID=A0A9P8PX77_WICPI|nr:hypothetical protein WICPIJ_008482 [Wickerhamomyces pijperi]
MWPWYLNKCCFNWVKAVTTLASLPVDKECNSKLLEINCVTISVSAAVPAPAHQILGANLCNFSQFLSATISPAVALVSAAMTTPLANLTPTIVVPVEVAVG